LNNFVIESKDIRENCLCPLGIVGSSSMHRICESDFVIFKPKVYEILARVFQLCTGDLDLIKF